MPALRYAGALLLGLTVVCATIPSARSASRATPSPAPPSATSAVPEMRIAAVVNDEVISVYDLDSRVRLVLLSSNIPDSA
jgi:hypothetical protein